MRAKYILSEMMVGLWRNVTMTVAMIITMGVSLTTLGASLVLYQQVDSMKGYYYDQVEVAIFLEAVTDDQRTAIRQALEADPLVKKPIRYETKDQAYARFKEEFKSTPDLVEATNAGAIPESFRIKLTNQSQFDQIKSKYKAMVGVNDVIDQKQLLNKVFGMLGAVQKIALILAIAEGVAALLLVGNTIQVAAFSRRREVGVMKLVGASNWFIQAPFVLEAMFAGIIGAILASLALVAVKVWLVDGALKSIIALMTPVYWSRILLMAPILIGIGALVSGVTGWVTLRFYIKK
jgi:cell division transport system permease protein